MVEHTCKIGNAPEEEPLPDTEPTLGLSPKEKHLINESWKLVKQDLTGNAHQIMLTFLKDHPQNLQYFPFRDKPMEELATDDFVKFHATRVIRDLGFCVENIQKPKTVLHALKQNALNHRKRNIRSGAYDELRESILKVLAAKLGNAVFTEEARATWDKALSSIFGTILEVMMDGECHCPK